MEKWGEGLGGMNVGFKGRMAIAFGRKNWIFRFFLSLPPR